eukprot:PhF_6_TR33585/c0_g1_i6/m.49023/K08851/TP53RK, PRPK, BUD32; TP53 regulating kinase and related kinases
MAEPNTSSSSSSSVLALNPSGYTLHEVLHQCAESKVFHCSLSSTNHPLITMSMIAKVRLPKPYRKQQLDNHLRTRRTNTESRMLQKCEKLGIRVPKVIGVDTESATILMERLQGITLNQYLQTCQKEGRPMEHAFPILERTGAILAQLHLNDIIHGDLTTSNFMVVVEDVAVIDFGLASISHSPEDRAVDLYVLERAFGALHPGSVELMAVLYKGYEMEMVKSDAEKYKATMSRLEDVKARGRKRTMIG